MACMRFIHCDITLQRNRPSQAYLLFLFMILMMATSKSLVFMVQGRQQAPTLPNASPRKFKYVEKGLNMRFPIGSRPPRCERRWENCEHCEAVQVPISPASMRYFQKEIVINGNNIIPRILTYSRGDDISNYKPMSWKCKCGDFIFNP